MNWKDCISLTIKLDYSKDRATIAIPKNWITSLKKLNITGFGSSDNTISTVITMNREHVVALGLRLNGSTLQEIYELHIEEDYKVVLGLLQDNAATKILHGE